jgi:hypothetical protein
MARNGHDQRDDGATQEQVRHPTIRTMPPMKSSASAVMWLMNNCLAGACIGEYDAHSGKHPITDLSGSSAFAPQVPFPAMDNLRNITGNDT